MSIRALLLHWLFCSAEETVYAWNQIEFTSEVPPMVLGRLSQPVNSLFNTGVTIFEKWM